MGQHVHEERKTLLRMCRMTHDDLKRLIQGPLATVPTAFDAKLKLDLGVMAERTKWWVANGLSTGKAVIKVAAAGAKGRT